MPSNERLPQKPARTTSRKTSNPMSANATQDQSGRDTQYDDEYLLSEDDPYASNPPRPHSSAIRLSPQAQTPRRSSGRDANTETQTIRRVPLNNIPQRSTQKQSPGQVTGIMPPRSTRNVTTAYDTPPPKKQGRRHVHWLLYVGMGMLIALALWVLAGNVLNWGTNQYNTVVYGYPRTYQTDAVVGHNDSVANPSHFIAINLHGQIIVIEIPGGDPSKAIDYTGPDLIGPGEDLLPVTLSFSDQNQDGKIDMIIHVSDRSFVFYNNGTKFAANNPTPTATP